VSTLRPAVRFRVVKRRGSTLFRFVRSLALVEPPAHRASIRGLLGDRGVFQGREETVMRGIRAGVAVLAALASATLAHAQGTSSIVGSVRDSSGGALPGATVTVSDAAHGVTQAMQTSPEGTFVFAQIPPGTYTVGAELAGFKKVERSNVILPTASKVNVGTLVLEVGNVSETVTVEADVGRLQIQTEAGDRPKSVPSRQLRDVALNGRNIVDFMKLVPGVITARSLPTSTVTNVVDQLNINGTRSLQHEYTVDGVTNLNLGNNTGGLVSVNPDAVEEVKVLTSNYQAEYARSGGGLI